MTPLALILRTAGTNCDRELAHAFELAGAATEAVHLSTLVDDPARLERYDLIGFPGGFSYGDDIAAGRILANRLRHRLAGPLQQCLARGVPMIGVCNGFQAIVKLGLLPFPDDMTAARQSATLADNNCGRFIDRWVGMHAEESSVCVWTKGLGDFDLPIAHGEGRFVPATAEVLQTLRERGQVALRYRAFAGDEGAGAANPNGSVDDIAGVCDPSGLVLGLMPHPERHTHLTHHPHWTRRPRAERDAEPAGLRFFRNAVEHVQAQRAATSTPLPLGEGGGVLAAG